MIDAHVHAFPERMLRAIYDWFAKADWTIPNPDGAREILDAIERSGCRRAFVLVYAHKSGVARGLNRWLAGLASEDLRVIPFGCVHPDDLDLADVAREAFDQFGFPGIKLHCNVGRFRADDPRLDELWRMAAARDRLVVVHAGTAPSHDQYVGLATVANVLERFPHLKMQLPHLGFSEWRLAFELLERYSSLVLDTANILDSTRLAAPNGRDFLKQFRAQVLRHPTRILYGSDYPILEAPLGIARERFSELRLGDELERRLLGGNAAEFLGSPHLDPEY